MARHASAAAIAASPRAKPPPSHDSGRPSMGGALVPSWRCERGESDAGVVASCEAPAAPVPVTSLTAGAAGAVARTQAVS
eukprot:6312091-Prymnesium_polylepis.1